MKYLILITLILFVDRAQAQTAGQPTGIPEVFLIGQYEDSYAQLSQQHPEALLSVYNDNIEKAYKGWSEFLMDIEDYASDISFDIKGAKIWLNVYFNADGSISNLAFYPKPNSRNIEADHLVAFFKSFVKHYQYPEMSEKGFQHSASASFPTFFHRTSPVTAKGN